MALPETHVASPSAAALAWLTHWSTCVALVLLVVNDHVLKAAYGTWWTGKLSDLAWLVVAAPLLATVAAGAAHVAGHGRATARACSLVGLTLSGTAFVLVKTTAAGADAASSALSSLAGPSVVLADATDLLVLPAALAISVAAARGTWTSRGRAPRSALVLVLLPATVLATAATSQAEPNEALHVVVLGDFVVVGDSSSRDPEGSTWHLSDDGGAHWQTIPGYSDEADLVTSQVERAGGTVQSACVPPDDDPCFRVETEGLGVERSDDGGRTWEQEWAVTGDALVELKRRYENEHADLGTVGLAIQQTSDGFRVYAAGAEDGVAIRDEDGTWTRIGYTYRHGVEGVVPLPGEPTTLHHPVPVGVALVAPAGLLTLALAGRRLPRTSPTGARAGLGVAVAAAIVSVPAVLANQSWAVVDGVDVGARWVLGPLIPVGVVSSLAIVSTVLMVAAASVRGWRVAWLVLATSAGVAVAMSLVTPPVLAVLVSAAVVAAGVTVIGRTRTPPVDAGSPTDGVRTG